MASLTQSASGLLHPQAPQPGGADDVRRVLHELQVHQVELAQQNEALQETRAELASSLARYAALYAHAPVGLLTVDRDGTVRELNARAQSLLRCTATQAVGRSLLAFATQDTADALRRALAPMPAPASLRSVEFALPAGDGQRWLLQAEIQSAGHAGARLLLALTDVTERRRVEGELAHARQILELSNRVARIGTWDYALQRPEMAWSEVAREILGVDAGYRCGLEDSLAFYKDGTHRERVREAMAAAIAQGQAFDLELQITTAQGQDRWVRKIGIAEMHGGRCRRLYGTLQDIDARMRAEQARLAQARAEAANRAKSVFLARMSHELRTPLNAVVGFSHLLQRAPAIRDSARELAQVRHIQEAGRHLTAMIEDILDLARIEAGTLVLKCEAVEVQPLLAECLTYVEQACQQRGISLRVERPAVVTHVLCDATRLRQVLVNLLSNAVKYNHEGGTVDVRIALPAGRVEITVQDSGPGLSAEQIANLFQPFNRLGAEYSTVEGTGLGLVIAHTLVQAMAGTLSVRCTPGQGAAFTASLQRAEVQPPTAPPRPADPTAAWSTGEPRLRVLYVEDNAVNAEVVNNAFMERPGIELVLASDGPEGLEAAGRLRPDLILLDMHLPRLDGMAVFRALRADPALAHVPCVAVSANAMPGDIRSALDAGFEDYLTKPVDLDHLLEVVDRVCATRPRGAG